MTKLTISIFILSFFTLACSNQQHNHSKPVNFVGYYERTSLAASSPQLIIGLLVKEDSTALFGWDYCNSTPEIVDTCQWAIDENNKLNLQYHDKVLIIEKTEEGISCFNEEEFGQKGLQLKTTTYKVPTAKKLLAVIKKEEGDYWVSWGGKGITFKKFTPNIQGLDLEEGDIKEVWVQRNLVDGKYQYQFLSFLEEE